MTGYSVARFTLGVTPAAKREIDQSILNRFRNDGVTGWGLKLFLWSCLVSIDRREKLWVMSHEHKC
jgi:hypothetical protein